MEIDNCDDEDIEKYQELFEIEELKNLENQIQKVEEEKINLLKKERESEAELLEKSGQIGLTIDHLERQNEFKMKERERALTKLYARMNSKFKYAIFMADGHLQTQQRKIKKFIEQDKKDKMLFDGIRDQKLKVKWIKTPQAVSCKVLVARCLRDKVPKGEFVIRASVLDRLIQNKMQYKFIEHGQRIKD